MDFINFSPFLFFSILYSVPPPQATRIEQEPNYPVYVGKYDYDSRTDDDLSFKKGTVHVRGGGDGREGVEGEKSMDNISSGNIILYLLNFENEIATMFEIFIKYVLLDKIHV